MFIASVAQVRLLVVVMRPSKTDRRTGPGTPSALRTAPDGPPRMSPYPAVTCTDTGTEAAVPRGGGGAALWSTPRPRRGGRTRAVGAGTRIRGPAGTQ
jgi:hypothetical protein